MVVTKCAPVDTINKKILANVQLLQKHISKFALEKLTHPYHTAKPIKLDITKGSASLPHLFFLNIKAKFYTKFVGMIMIYFPV
jgi:hypothetical protein